MIERHYDDEVLISLLDSSRAAADTHLPNCPPCTTKIESFRTVADVLCDGDVWDTRAVRTEAVPATIATLRAFANRMTDEDTRAEAMLQELLAGAREEWMPRLREHGEWWTAGVVRKLIAASYEKVFSMPPDALEMAAISTTVAEDLDVEDHPSDTVARLRGSAWRANAYVLFYLGRFADAETALATSERHFGSCAINEYDMARVGVVKTLVLRPFERFAEASAAAAASARTFERYGDVEKTASARLAEVHILVSRQQFVQAEQMLLDLERQVASSDHVNTHARVLGNLGELYRKMGKIELAIHNHDCASALLSELGARTETVRLQWGIAVMLAETGKVTDACDRLRDVTREMEYLGMTSEVALASLDVAEFLLVQNRYAEVDAICHSTMRSFELAGLAYTSRALTALGYIREAAAQKRADRTLVRTVREYIRKLPTQPNLLYAPPPP